MFRQILPVLFTVVMLGGITAPAFASPASGRSASASSFQICTHLNSNQCLSSQGIGAQVTITDNDRTTYIDTGFTIFVANELGHCLVADGSIVETSTSCGGRSAEWTITNGHYKNADGNCYLAVFNPPSQGEGVACVQPTSSWDWTWDQVSR
ncbi:MAG TPA: hypothetical protein VFB06_05580 [Streptosporangiaceae bacterium]|nr:hypothetical protein [Streptosporangiaceae bacterium]